MSQNCWRINLFVISTLSASDHEIEECISALICISNTLYVGCELSDVLNICGQWDYYINLYFLQIKSHPSVEPEK